MSDSQMEQRDPQTPKHPSQFGIGYMIGFREAYGKIDDIISSRASAPDDESELVEAFIFLTYLSGAEVNLKQRFMEQLRGIPGAQETAVVYGDEEVILKVRLPKEKVEYEPFWAALDHLDSLEDYKPYVISKEWHSTDHQARLHCSEIEAFLKIFCVTDQVESIFDALKEHQAVIDVSEVDNPSPISSSGKRNEPDLIARIAGSKDLIDSLIIGQIQLFPGVVQTRTYFIVERLHWTRMRSLRTWSGHEQIVDTLEFLGQTGDLESTVLSNPTYPGRVRLGSNHWEAVPDKSLSLDRLWFGTKIRVTGFSASRLQVVPIDFSG
ncbi:MAG: NfeD family protein [Candidatus Heimdallarchaeota archaeon]|nr:NfeD family protein [Candidatus Heimdallarchaeota archaeon]